MSEPYINTHEAASRTGLTQLRITQLARAGKLDGYIHGHQWYVREADVVVLRQEQSYWPRKQVCEALGITEREFGRLVQKGIIEARNTISELQLFHPADILYCRLLVATSYSKAEVASMLDCSLRTVHRLIGSGTIEEIETVHGLRVPFENLGMYFMS